MQYVAGYLERPFLSHVGVSLLSGPIESSVSSTILSIARQLMHEHSLEIPGREASRFLQVGANRSAS